MKSESWQWDLVDTKSSFGYGHWRVRLVYDQTQCAHKNTYRPTFYPNIMMLGKIHVHVVSQQHKCWISAQRLAGLNICRVELTPAWNQDCNQGRDLDSNTTIYTSEKHERMVHLDEKRTLQVRYHVQDYCLEVQTCRVELLSVSCWLDCEKGE